MFTKLMISSAVALGLAAGAAFAQEPAVDEEEELGASEEQLLEEDAEAAEEPLEEDVAEEPVETPDGPTIIAEQSQDQMLTTDIVGEYVMHDEHGRLGTIEALILDDEWRVTGAVMSTGGFLGLGAKRIAVSWEAIEMRPGDEGGLFLAMTPEEIDEAPAFRDLATQEAEAAAPADPLADQPAVPVP